MEDSNFLLSIAVITYNRADLLDRCLGELEKLDSCPKEIELLVLDNDSCDETHKVVERRQSRLAEKFTTRSIKWNTNIGALSSLFRGIGIARGKYFLFLGDDDRLLADQFERLLDVLRSSPEFCLGVETDRIISTCRGCLLRPAASLFRRSREFSAMSPLYKAGNSWAGIYNTKIAQETFRSSPVLEWGRDNVWAQVSLSILMLSKSELPALMVGFRYGEQFQSRPFDFGGMTALKSLAHLLIAADRASNSVDPSAAKEISRQLCNSPLSPSMRHLRTLLTSWPGSVARSSSLWLDFVGVVSRRGSNFVLHNFVVGLFWTPLPRLATNLANLLHKRPQNKNLEAHY